MHLYLTGDPEIVIGIVNVNKKFWPKYLIHLKAINTKRPHANSYYVTNKETQLIIKEGRSRKPNVQPNTVKGPIDLINL